MSNTGYITEDTIVALATSSGTNGAIAVIRVSGQNAIKITNEIFKGKNLLQQASHTIHFGTIRDGEEIIDEVLVSLFVAPNSYTRENSVEISTHNSKYIIERVVNLLIKKGARAARPGEFTLRAFLNGGMDLSQAEAVADLIASNSAASHQVAMQQMRGGFSNQLKSLREDLIHFASLIELELDFSEEDVEFANRDQLKNLINKIQVIVQKLIQSFEQGNVLKNGVPVVIAGKPNVGKSTLLNAFLNEERAIVSDIAGTTRDTIEDEINIHGVTFRFIDTAGIRETADVIEAKGVERTREKMKQARLIIYLFDPTQDKVEEVQAQLPEIERLQIPFVTIINKSDLLSEAQKDVYNVLNPLYISAKEQIGVEELKDELINRVQLGNLNTDDVMVTNIRHVEALQKTADSLERVIYGINNPVTSDFLAMDIRQALYHLGEITGSVSTDDLLDNIFSKFCIGK
ncbi:MULTISPECIES: tRNA uridine-5-carboxymethylaminomethyl(34) synthesis GTPase MnmE [Sphingobacterium]|jgi:tRNA modification GTPase|uniref:tRNA modification GTPase MnmE n=3 Tax=Sphingobacterium multivorum TaxID=28454 RepID=A0A2X2J174_SPHMU|nr:MULTISPECIES: tRNA uridine-5-carboxymethylaminomethyl(34) synthesis GTPase MnmE [Sphingobacterium]HAL51466.1 tRNA uridine-5-carboxymethylaminomethyl(34) synthesis GTPase MnmE [Sphingobacterium sp.]MDF2851492.1 tRNA uridine-5-carboxymethylaminomethyl(34) synthesis GTPase MnmE [Sphingobacterium multivorum]OFV11077.1 tRNA modification GTPase [Sphingobacterium sp. HMSC13C05]OJZ07479.1 MAG: tRNA uridine-5-carboxymethylaminomethyl(34) synthesis GTPase MnmE [Sphingobacterium sp. 40-24]QQT45259.1 t